MSAPAMQMESAIDRHGARENAIFDLLVAVSSPAGAISCELLHGIDWDQLLCQARHHSLLPLLAHRLLQSSHASLLPGRVRDDLRRDFQSNLRRNFGLLEEVRRVLEAWQESGIAAMPYKGPALAEQLWGSFALRECSDLDFLVRREDVARAAEVLTAIGYQPEMPTPSWLGPSLLHNASELQFRHAKTNLLLELQWAPAPRTLAVSYNEAQLWRNRTSMPLAKINVTAPSPEDLLGLLVIHGWKHNWSKLIWIADVAMLVRRYELDWERISQSADENGWQRILLLGLEMMRQVYGVGQFPALADVGIVKLVSELRHRLRTASDASYFEWHRDMLRARDSRRDQTRQLAHFIFTPGLAEYTSYQLPSWAAPAYRMVRMARVAAMMKTKACE